MGKQTPSLIEHDWGVISDTEIITDLTYNEAQMKKTEMYNRKVKVLLLFQMKQLRKQRRKVLSEQSKIIDEPEYIILHGHSHNLNTLIENLEDRINFHAINREPVGPFNIAFDRFGETNISYHVIQILRRKNVQNSSNENKS